MMQKIPAAIFVSLFSPMGCAEGKEWRGVEVGAWECMEGGKVRGK
jgi:hypothetical protein